MRRFLLSAAGLLSLSPLLAFPYGPLFPWSPWKPGYDRIELKRADIFARHGQPMPEQYKRVDEYIEQAETFHRLKLPKRVTIVACANWGDFGRFLPFTGQPAAVTLATGTVIYVTPKIAERKLDTGEFLRHELSHAALYQNQRIPDAYRIGREQPWLSEGIAVWFGDQKSYNTLAQFMEYARTKPLEQLIDPAMRRADFDIRYGYVAWRHFNEYLVATKGRDAFQRYLLACMANPGEWREAFPKSFGSGFSQAIGDYQTALRAGAWAPKGAWAPRE